MGQYQQTAETYNLRVVCNVSKMIAFAIPKEEHISKYELSKEQFFVSGLPMFMANMMTPYFLPAVIMKVVMIVLRIFCE